MFNYRRANVYLSLSHSLDGSCEHHNMTMSNSLTEAQNQLSQIIHAGDIMLQLFRYIEQYESLYSYESN